MFLLLFYIYFFFRFVSFTYFVVSLLSLVSLFSVSVYFGCLFHLLLFSEGGIGVQYLAPDPVPYVTLFLYYGYHT